MPEKQQSELPLSPSFELGNSDGNLSARVTFLENQLLALKYQEQSLEAIFDQAVAGFVQTDQNGRFVKVNDRFCAIVGRKAEELIGLSCQDFTHPDDIPYGMPEAFPYVREKRYLRPDGSVVWVSKSVSALLDPAGNRIGAFAVILDISEQKLAALALEDRAESLMRANEQLERFAHVVSHDLKEPLRVIQTYVQFLERSLDKKSKETSGEAMTYISQSARQAQDIVDDLLAYYGLRAPSLNAIEVDCNDVVQEIAALLQPNLEREKATLRIERLPVIRTERQQLCLLFYNLLNNALKFRGERPPVILVSGRKVGKEAHFYVQDNGIGIAPEYFEQIFVLFERLHTRAQFPGTGVGLAICKKIAQLHGGAIWVESNLGEGSKFCFTLQDLPKPAKGLDV